MMRAFSKRSSLFPLGLLLAAGIAVTGCGDTGDSPIVADTLASSSPTTKGPAASTAPKPKPAAAAPDNPREDKNVTVKDGFQVELLYKIDKPTQGSWVALCKGPNGTLFATDQYNKEGQALYQITPAPIGEFETKTQVKAHPVKLNGAQGLYYGFGALYVMESGRENGLMRVTDSDGDGLMDKKELILNMFGGGEHGTHAIVPSPDGKGLYVIAGNMSPLPKLDASRSPKIWAEDQLLKREPDARGHASNVMAPGGWIVRLDPDGSNATLHCNGFRNAYDMDFHPNGELFTYDSDMEWDLGLPWYRPTRVNHAVSGAEFGWRNGSGKWPTYFEDSLSSVTDIGPGSPVGVLFGTGAKFPAKYQSALFCLDWTYGTIYAIHLSPDGASFTGERETFVYGKPLPLTDAAIGDDGAMYFTVGGRRGDSALYRVTYTGNQSTAPATVQPVNDLVKLRRKLETLQVANAPADQIDFIWSNVNHTDRHIRYAARVALEHQPVDRYLAKAKAETNAMTRTVAGLALARHEHPDAVSVLMGVSPEPGNETLNLAWMRAVGIVFARNGAPDDAGRELVLSKLAKLRETENDHEQVEIVRLRVFLKDPGAIQYAIDVMNNTGAPEAPEWLNLAAKNDRYGKAIIAMRDNPPPIAQFNIAFMLRNIKDGWTPQTRQAYFAWLNRAAQGGGGNSYKGYIAKVRNQAIETLSPEEKNYLAGLLTPPQVNPEYPLVDAQGPGRKWTVKIATRLVDGKLENRDFKRGIGLYQSTTCSQCHRVGDFGGMIGPDLTTVENKFTLETLMRAIIEPNHEISDQYKLTTVTTKAGREIIGQRMEDTADGVQIKPNVLNEDVVLVPRDQIASIEESELSPMPSGLINSLSADELRDLTAYIMSKDDPENKMFKQD